MYGRFQPLHMGHIALYNTARVLCDDVHIVLNATQGTPNNRNPFNVHQKGTMFLLANDDLPPQNLHYAKVYLGKGGDVSADVATLLKVFEKIAPHDKIVIPYHRKPDDIRSFLVDGEERRLHYVDLLTKPIGPLLALSLTEHHILKYVQMDAAHVRNGSKGDDYLNPRVSAYIKWQMAQAEVNGRDVGASAHNDTQHVPRPEILDVLDHPHFQNPFAHLNGNHAGESSGADMNGATGGHLSRPAHQDFSQNKGHHASPTRTNGVPHPNQLLRLEQ